MWIFSIRQLGLAEAARALFASSAIRIIPAALTVGVAIVIASPLPVRVTVGESAEYQQSRSAEQYACPMAEHGDVRSDKPGKCPKCDMDLVPVSQTDHREVIPSYAPRTEEGPNHAGHTATRHAAKSLGNVNGVVGDQDPERTTYYCPMHPTYTSDRPGTCPICNMTLVPLSKANRAMASDVDGHATIPISPERQQLIGVRKGAAEMKTVNKVIRAFGRVDYDERRLSAVSLKFSGWIEELLVNATGQAVSAGDPLMTLYSPEVLEAERTYLLALENERSLGKESSESTKVFAQQTLKSARDRLLLWDLTEGQLSDLETKGVPQMNVTLHSKVEGIVTHRNVVKGAAVQPGNTLYELADLSTVWILADVYEYEISEVHVGQDATISLATAPSESFSGKVTYVYPYLNETTRTVRVRIEAPNPDGKLKPGMYGNVQIAVSLGSRVVIDDQAIVDTGTQTIVFVDLGEGRFEPKVVILGPRADGVVVVEKGLSAGDRIITSGNFLVDSESRLKSALIAGSKQQPSDHAGHGR